MSDHNSRADVQAPSRRQQVFADWSIGILVDIIVLNLFVEHVDSVVIDSFSVTILTAVVLRALLVSTLALEHRISEFFKARPGALSTVLRISSAWLILFASKFLILEVIDLIFGEHVELGGFLMVIAIAAALIVAEKGLRRIYDSL